MGLTILTEVKNKLLWYLLWVLKGLLQVQKKLMWYLLWVLGKLTEVKNKLLWYLLWGLECFLRSIISYCGTYSGS